MTDKGDSKEIDYINALLMVDSASGYIQTVQLRNKNQWNLMVHELLSFAGLMGHSEVTFRCDNEPTVLQLQRMAINARLAMGLVTHRFTSSLFKIRWICGECCGKDPTIGKIP